MGKEIKYSGYSASPSDYECQDGELAMSVNLINEDGALRPVQPAVDLFSLTDLDVIKVHEHINTGYKHFIVVYNDNGIVKFNWCDGSQYQLQQEFLTFSAGEIFRDIVGIGNTLVITSDKKFYFYLWKDGRYNSLGNSVPNIKMSFALDGEVFSHVYNDKKVTISTDGKDTTTEEWQSLYNHSFSFAGVERDTWSEWQNIENVSLTANTEYRLYFTLPAYYFLDIVGKDANDNDVIILHGAYSRKVDRAYKITKSVNVTNLKVRVYQTLSQQPTMYLTLHIDEGNGHSVHMARIVEKTQENLDTIVGVLNHFTTKYANDEEKFIHPFFVRYAVKLYDETYAHISSPILMIPNSGCTPLLGLDHVAQSSDQTPVDYITAYAFIAELQYAFLNRLEDGWDDIISGVDIFISQPIYPYNQGVPFDTTDENMFVYKVIDNNSNVNEVVDYSYGHLRLSHGASIVDNYNKKSLYSHIVSAFDYGNQQHANQWISIQVSPYTNKEITDKIASTQNFYLVHSFDINALKDDNHEYKPLPLKNGTLNSDALVNRTKLDDNLLSYRTFLTGRLFDYNNRLHSFDVEYELPTPMAIDLQNNSHIKAEYINLVNNMYVYLHTSEGDKVVRGKYYSVLVQSGNYNGGFLPWFYYPDSRAYKVQFFNGNNQDELWFEIELKPHDFLSGAYYIAPSLDGEVGNSIVQGTPPTIDNTIKDVNCIYVSEVGNPFMFIDRYTTQVGCNKIYALSTAAKALSEGQFGQFPLYAFTDTGVWALEIEKGNGNYDGAAPGTYIARQPITRDVCLSAASITQLDDSVIFSTDRGIMLLSGSTSICLTDVLMSDDLFLPTELTGLTNVCESGVAITPVKFRTFLASCKMLYDYAHQRIIVYNPTKSYAYIYSLKSKLWGMMPCNIKSAINSYPECLALDNNNKVVDFSSVTNSSSVVNGLLVTRPVKLEQDILKTIQSVIQRGEFNFNDSLRNVKPIRTVLYGSRDLYNWHLVWSSQDHILRGFSGTPYKYYRIALLCALKPNESVSGCSVLYEPKLTDKLR